jgi:hypothetical protein
MRPTFATAQTAGHPGRRLARLYYIVAVYLIVIGLVGLLGAGHFHIT